MSAYQPVWRDGAVVAGGERDCADRYGAIRDVLADVAEDSPFTVLDVGAAQGYFSVRAAEDFGCRVTAVDSDRRLADAASERVRTCIRRVDPPALRAMARHDVVLALSVLHHFADWRAALRQIRACRRWAIVEVPHPGERWMRSAAARGELRQIHDAVERVAVRRLGEFERTGRDGTQHKRPMFLLPGTIETITGRVFGGSGTCSRRLPEFGAGIQRELGYLPFWGSLNVRADGSTPDLGKPHVNWNGRNRRGRGRRYWFWPAWIQGHAGRVHAMDPAGRGHGPECIEVVAPDKLRDVLKLQDGSVITMDVEANR